MTDNTGSEVMSALNEQMCRDVAKAGGGAYIHVDNTNLAQEQLNNELTKLQKGELSSVIYSEYDEQFQAFGILVLLLLIIEVCVLESKNPLLKNVKLFKKK
jgi:Ca-activated chloride channel family protein